MKYALLIVAISLLHEMAYAQEQASTFEAKKSGKFILKNQFDKCPGTEIAMFSKNLATITDWFHQNNLVFNPHILKSRRENSLVLNRPPTRME